MQVGGDGWQPKKRSQWERETVGQKVKGQMAKKAWAKAFLAVGSDGCMASRQSAKLIEGTWVGLLMGERGRKWTTEWVKVNLSTLRILVNTLIK